MPPLFRSPNYTERLPEGSQKEAPTDVSSLRIRMVCESGFYHLPTTEARTAAEAEEGEIEECPRCLTVLNADVGPRCPFCGTCLRCEG